MKGKLLLVVFLLVSVEAQRKGPQYFECPVGEVINRVYATFHRGRSGGYDRDYQWYCRELAMYTVAGCSWSTYVNGWRRDVNYTCPGGRILTGVQSSYKYRWYNGGDRRFMFKCCAVPRMTLRSCSQGAYINGHRGLINYTIPSTRVLNGWHNSFSRSRLDRRWAPRTCAYTISR